MRDLFEDLTAASELVVNGFDRRHPDEGSGILIPCCQELRNRVLQVFHTTERTATHQFGSPFSESALDKVEPTETGRHEMRANAYAFDSG